MNSLMKKMLAGGLAVIAQSSFAANEVIPSVELPASRTERICQAIVASAEKVLAHAADPSKALVLENPIGRYSNAYPIVEQANRALETISRAMAETQGTSATSSFKGVVNLKNGKLEETVDENDTALHLIISEFPSSWEAIGINPANIKSLSVPNALKAWPQEALSGCTNLEEFLTYGPEPESVEGGIRLEKEYFTNCQGIKTLELPSIITEIGDGDTGYYCKPLFPSSIRSIKFSSSLTSIGSYVFYGCESLTSVTFPASLKTIGSSTFGGCTGLTSVTFPASLTSIGSRAFSSCTSLTSVALPASLTSISVDFSFCKSLTSIDLSQCTAITTLNSSFKECSNLSSVILPPSITTIESFTFRNCPSLTSIDLSVCKGLTGIGQQAFQNCTSLKTVWFPETLTNINKSAFSYGTDDPTASWNFTSLSKLNTIIWDGGRNTDYDFGSQAKHYLRNADGSLTPLGEESGSGAEGSFAGVVNLNATTGAMEATIDPNDTNLRLMISEFPSSWEAIGINPANIKSLSVPNALKAWPQEALAGCTNLEEFLTYGPEPESVENEMALTLNEYRGNNYLPSQGKLKVLQLPSIVTSIPDDGNGAEGDASFWSSFSSLKSIKFSSFFKSIDDCGLLGRTSLTFVAFPASLTKIGYGTFFDCSSLTSVDLSKCTALTSIEGQAFQGCSGLTSVTFPSSLKTIGYMAFCECTGLTSVTFPASLTTIDTYAFWNCTGLTSVTLPASLKTISTGAFNGTSLKTIIWDGGRNTGYDFGSQAKHYLRNADGSLTELS